MYETNPFFLRPPEFFNGNSTWYTSPSHGFDASDPSAAWHVIRSTHRSLKHLQVVMLLNFFQRLKQRWEKWDINFLDIIIFGLIKDHDFVDMFLFRGRNKQWQWCISWFWLTSCTPNQTKATHTAFRYRSFFCFRQVVGVKSYVSFGKVIRIFIRSHDMSHFLPGWLT